MTRASMVRILVCTTLISIILCCIISHDRAPSLVIGVDGQALTDTSQGVTQLLPAATLVEQSFPTNLAATLSSTTTTAASTNAAAVQLATTFTLRAAVMTVAAAFVASAAAAYQATLNSFAINFYYAPSNAGIKAAFVTAGGYDVGVCMQSATVADYQVMPTIAYYPLMAVGVVTPYNLPSSVTQGATLAWTGLTLCRIFRANITRWTDPAITSANVAMNWNDPSILNAPITVLTLTSGTASHLTFTTYCKKIDSGWTITPASIPAYPTSLYAGSKLFANLDLVCNGISDNMFSITITPLSNAKSVSLKIASMINAAGVAIAPTTNAISFTVLELGANGYAAGLNSYDLTNPAGLQAWPMAAMIYILLDSINALTTCANKKMLVVFLLWLYSSPVVVALANSLYLVMLPTLFISQLNIVSRLSTEISCYSAALVQSNTAVGSVVSSALGSNLLTLFSQFYISVDTSRSYSISNTAESLAIKRLVSGELDFALVNAAALSDADVALMTVGGVQSIPAFVVGISPIFNLPTSIQTLYANPTAVATLGLPPLYPLYLSLELMTALFIGMVSNWLDPQLTTLNPQLTSWFAATGASTNLTLVVGATSPASPLRATKLLFQSMSASATAKLAASAFAFPAGGWTTTDASGASVSVNPFAAVGVTITAAFNVAVTNGIAPGASMPVSMIFTDVESRLTLKSSITSGSVSYRLLGSGTSTTSTTGKTDPTVEWQMVQTNANGVREIVQPTTGAMRQCSTSRVTIGVSAPILTSAMASTSLDGVDAGAVSSSMANMASVAAQRNWISPTSPPAGCWPISTLLSFVVPMTFVSSASTSSSSSVDTSSVLTSASCKAGLHALEFIHYVQTTPILTAPSESSGIIRLAESTLVHRLSEQTLYSATCDGAPLLVILPLYYTVPSAITAFGIVASILGLVAIVITTGFVIKFRNQIVIRSSSAPFMLLILLGLAMLLCAVITWSQTSPTKLNCGMFQWLSNLGFSLLFVPLFLKTWRVYRIFSGNHLKVVKLPNSTLMMFAAIPIACDILFLGIWQGISPMTPITFTKLIDGRINYYTHCSVNNNGMTFVALEGLYKASMLLFGAVMAFSTRNVKGTFNEASAIAWSIYNTLLAGIITIAIITFISAIETTLIVLVQIFMFWLVFITFGLLFGPKLYHLTLSEEANIEATRSQLPQEISNGFSFASATAMTNVQLKQYYYALKIQLNRVETQLNVAVTKFAGILFSLEPSAATGTGTNNNSLPDNSGENSIINNNKKAGAVGGGSNYAITVNSIAGDVAAGHNRMSNPSVSPSPTPSPRPISNADASRRRMVPSTISIGTPAAAAPPSSSDVVSRHLRGPSGASSAAIFLPPPSSFSPSSPTISPMTPSDEQSTPLIPRIGSTVMGLMRTDSESTIMNRRIDLSSIDTIKIDSMADNNNEQQSPVSDYIASSVIPQTTVDSSSTIIRLVNMSPDHDEPSPLYPPLPSSFGRSPSPLSVVLPSSPTLGGAIAVDRHHSISPEDVSSNTTVAMINNALKSPNMISVNNNTNSTASKSATGSPTLHSAKLGRQPSSRVSTFTHA